MLRSGFVHLGMRDFGVAWGVFGGEGGEGEHPQQGHDEACVFVGSVRQVLLAAQGALVVELDLFAAECLGKCVQAGGFGIVWGDGGGNGLGKGDALQQQGEFGECVVKACAFRRHLACLGD